MPPIMLTIMFINISIYVNYNAYQCTLRFLCVQLYVASKSFSENIRGNKRLKLHTYFRNKKGYRKYDVIF